MTRINRPSTNSRGNSVERGYHLDARYRVQLTLRLFDDPTTARHELHQATHGVVDFVAEQIPTLEPVSDTYWFSGPVEILDQHHEWSVEGYVLIGRILVDASLLDNEPEPEGGTRDAHERWRVTRGVEMRDKLRKMLVLQGRKVRQSKPAEMYYP